MAGQDLIQTSIWQVKQYVRRIKQIPIRVHAVFAGNGLVSPSKLVRQLQTPAFSEVDPHTRQINSIRPIARRQPVADPSETGPVEEGLCGVVVPVNEARRCRRRRRIENLEHSLPQSRVRRPTGRTTLTASIALIKVALVQRQCGTEIPLEVMNANQRVYEFCYEVSRHAWWYNGLTPQPARQQ